MREVTCPECNGYGCKESYYLVRDKNGDEHYVRDVVTCLQCGGSGRIYFQRRQEIKMQALPIIWIVGIPIWFLLCGVFDKELKEQGLDPIIGFGFIWPFMIFLGLMIGTCALLIWAGSKIRKKLNEKQ